MKISFPKYYDKETFKKDIEKGCTFNFKTKLIWIIFFMFGNLIWILFTIFVMLGSIVGGGILLFIVVIILIIEYSFIHRKIEITPEGISGSWGFSSGYIKFTEIEDIEFYPSFLFNINTAKIFLYSGKKYKVRTSYMTAPKKWYSEEMIRTIIDNYWRKANPDAKYSTKSVSSVPSPQGKTISLIKPSANLPKDEPAVPQGYKCPNCLVIHDKKQNYCPKCGANMQ